MSEATVSEEQVLHNELSFEINQELIHLMKRIVEIEQQCKKQKEVIDRAIEYLEAKRIREKAIVDIDVLEGILKEVE